MDKKSKNTMGFLKNELNTLRQADRTNVLIIKELQAIVSRVDDVRGIRNKIIAFSIAHSNYSEDWHKKLKKLLDKGLAQALHSWLKGERK